MPPPSRAPAKTDRQKALHVQAAEKTPRVPTPRAGEVGKTYSRLVRLQDLRHHELPVHRRLWRLQAGHPRRQRAGLQVPLRDVGVVALVVHEALWAYSECALSHVRLDGKTNAGLALQAPRDEKLLFADHLHIQDVHARVVLVVLHAHCSRVAHGPLDPVPSAVLHRYVYAGLVFALRPVYEEEVIVKKLYCDVAADEPRALLEGQREPPCHLGRREALYLFGPAVHVLRAPAERARPHGGLQLPRRRGAG